MNKELRNLLLGGTALIGAGLLVPEDTDAQVAPSAQSVTQSPFHADAAVFFSQLGTQTTCTQVGQAVQTMTITPPAGQYVYITGMYLQQISAGNTTGAASTVAFTSTNLTGSPVWVLSDSTNAAVAPNANNYQMAEIYPTAIKSTVAGTAVTVVQSASSTSAAICGHAVGYYSPL